MEESVNRAAADVAGFYTQPYNQIVKPEQVWVVSKYFLRRWVPYYLGPTRFWTVVAARHLAYLSQSKKRFQAHDARVYKETGCSKRTYARVKAEMGDEGNPLSLFVRREDTGYESHDGQVRPGQTVYHVRLDDVLTPGDATHLAAWLQAQKVERHPTAVGELLAHMLTLPSTELLAPSLRPYAADPPAQYKPITAADVVRRVFGNKVLEDETVFEKCDALHTHLTGTAYIGRQYFRQAWVNELGAGPAYLLVYLRSYCFQDEAEGKLRNEITTTRPDLAEALGVDRVTLFRWLKKIESQTPDAQPFSPFLEEVESSRIAGNDVEIRFKVELREPLTAESLKDYRILVTEIESLLQNGTHENDEEIEPALQNGIHETGEALEPALQNGTHENEGIKLLLLQNGTHEQPGVAKWHSRTGSALQNGTTGVAKWHTFKHYKHLFFKILSEEAEENTFAAAAAQSEWKLDGDQALYSFAAAAVGNLEGLCDVVGIHGTPRTAVCTSGLSLEQAVAWYLYALTQPKLTQTREGQSSSLPGYIVNRLRENAAPPVEFERLASMSWELWRCYACLLRLPTSYLDAFERNALFVSWFVHYGRCQSDQLPLNVGTGVAEFIDGLPDEVLYGEQKRPFLPEAGLSEAAGGAIVVTDYYQMSEEEAALWKATLNELAPQMDKATFNTWLKETRLHTNGGGEATLFVRNEYAASWINGRLKPTLDRTLTAVARRELTVTAQVLME